MEPNFTLTALQKRAEAMSGRHLHKQNFRRLVENTGIVEEVGTATGDLKVGDPVDARDRLAGPLPSGRRPAAA